MEIAHKIYRLFDEAQLEYANRNNKQTDKYAESIIYRLAKAMKYNRGVVPTLDPSTDYDALKDMKVRLIMLLNKLKMRKWMLHQIMQVLK